MSVSAAARSREDFKMGPYNPRPCEHGPHQNAEEALECLCAEWGLSKNAVIDYLQELEPLRRIERQNLRMIQGIRNEIEILIALQPSATDTSGVKEQIASISAKIVVLTNGLEVVKKEQAQCQTDVDSATAARDAANAKFQNIHSRRYARNAPGSSTKTKLNAQIGPAMQEKSRRQDLLKSAETRLASAKGKVQDIESRISEMRGKLPALQMKLDCLNVQGKIERSKRDAEGRLKKVKEGIQTISQKIDLSIDQFMEKHFKGADSALVERVKRTLRTVDLSS